MIQDLVLPVTGTAGDKAALAAAITLAARMGAHLSVVQTVRLPMPLPSPWGIVPDAIPSDLYTQLRDQAHAEGERLRRELEREDISHEVRLTEAVFTEPPQTVALQARYADLAIIPGATRDAGPDAGVIHRYFSALLFESGRPVLVVPATHALQLPITHAVVAWKPTREATRALHDALPLLRAASSVDVVTVDPAVGEFEHGELPGADIAAHLARHGLEVNVVAFPRQSESAASVVLRHARETGAQLLVAGGYGHSRLREWVLGGATRELLEAAPVPILFSH